MNIGKSWLRLVLMMALTTGTLAAQAADAVRALVFIPPQEYAHETLLRLHFINYWFSQGEVVEPVVLQSLKPVFGETAICSGNRAADAVVMIQPYMFYNPYMTTFYGKIEARVFSGSGKLIASYKAKVEHSGYLDVLPREQIKVTYQAAMSEVVRQMQADSVLQAFMAQGVPDSETRMPCGMVAILPPQK